MALWSHVLLKKLILIGLTLDYQLGIYTNLTRNTGDWKNVYNTLKVINTINAASIFFQLKLQL